MYPLYTVTTNGQVITAGIVPGGDSHNGHYVSKAVIQTALDLGWNYETAVQAVSEYDESYYLNDWRFAEHWYDIVTEAEEWLNEHTPDGIWSWHDGDFRVDAIEPCPHCGADRYADRNVDPYSECPDHLD